MTAITEIENGKAFTGEAFIEGYVKVRAIDDITRYVRLTVDRRLFDAIPGQTRYYRGEKSEVWVKTLTDKKSGFEIEARTFYPPEGDTRVTLHP